MSGKYREAEPPKVIACRRCGFPIQISWTGQFWHHTRSGSTLCREEARDQHERAEA